MHAEKIQSFVLSSRDYGETDRIVSLFSLEYGAIRAFARGAKKSRKRFGAALESFTRMEAQIRLKEGLASLHQAEIISIYSDIRRNLPRIAHALYACELVEAMAPEGHPLPRLYRLLAAYLEHLEQEEATEDDRRFLEINLLNILGYRPALESCSCCGIPFNGNGALLPENSALSCQACARTGRRISVSALRSLSACLGTSRFGSVHFETADLFDAGFLLERAIVSHAGRQIKSLEFLKEVG